MHRYLINMLVCPYCPGGLVTNIVQSHGDHVEIIHKTCLVCTSA